MEVINILENAKKDLLDIIQEIDLNDIDKSEEEISHYFSFLRSLRNVRNCPVEKSEPQIIGDIENNGEGVKINTHVGQIESSEEDVKLNAPPLKKPMYIFERFLRGGMVQDINGFVPEMVVRSLGLEDGDYVYAEEIKTDNSSSKRYEYTFAMEGDRPAKEQDRIQINYGLVTRVAGRLAVEEYFDGSDKRPIKINEAPYTFILNEKDADYFNIKEGDTIDLAFKNGSPDSHRIIWLHKSEIDFMPTIESKTLSFKGDVPKDATLQERDFEQTLKGKTILVVGNEPKKTLYKTAIENHGGDFIFINPKDKVESYEPKVRKADQVIFLLKVSGHRGMEHIKKLCKEYGIPFDTTWSNGISTVKRMAQSG